MLGAPGKAQATQREAQCKLQIHVAREMTEDGDDVLLADFKGRVEGQLLGQLQFYFSETNLLRDRWLRKQLEEGGGWIDVGIIRGASTRGGVSGCGWYHRAHALTLHCDRFQSGQADWCQ